MNSVFALNSHRNRALRVAVILGIAPALILADFATDETFFVNRVLDSVSLLLLAGLLHVWMRSVRTRAAQSRLITDQKEKLQAAAVSRRMLEVQENERRAIASQLHDLVGQKLTALSINLTMARSQLGPNQARQTGARLDDSMKMVEETTEHIRDVMTELRPAVLDDFGLAPALRWYAAQFSQRTGVVASMVEDGAGHRPAPAAEHALNGKGFDPAAVQPPTRDHGWGSMIMRERAAAIGAQLEVVSAPGQGTCVVVTMDGDAHDQGPARG